MICKFTVDLINGFGFCLEHINVAEDSEDTEYLIALTFLCFRFGMFVAKEEE